MSINASQDQETANSFLITAGLEYIYADMLLTEMMDPYYSPENESHKGINSQDSTETWDKDLFKGAL